MKEDDIVELCKKLRKSIKNLKPCPFCGCEISILISPSWGFQWHGEHKEGICILEGNPSASYGRIDTLIEEWNKRV
jgi:hypothetical protein